MPRKGPAGSRELKPDPVYNSKLVSAFVNKIMVKGKRSLAERIFYKSMDIIEKKTGKDPLKVFNLALENVMPVIEVRPRRVGGATYQVPVEVRPERRVSLGMRWLLNYARARSGKSMEEKLAAELIDASQGIGASIKKKEDTHKMAEANKAFAHYRW
ncbi:MAG: 30S ribosomal protein S7 [Candidatus Eremiobacteraeota bacterium]|nr:30S ribosomal protein S7 [Candidatus Eremiobacteraeota bacterium]